MTNEQNKQNKNGKFIVSLFLYWHVYCEQLVAAQGARCIFVCVCVCVCLCASHSVCFSVYMKQQQQSA